MAENAAPFKKHVSLKMQLRVRGIRLNMKLKALSCKLRILKIILLLYISFHPLNQMYAQVRSFVMYSRTPETAIFTKSTKGDGYGKQ